MHLQERRAKNPLGITVCIFNVILMLYKKNNYDQYQNI